MENYERFTISALQEILREHGLPVNYKRKFDLIERVVEAVEKQRERRDSEDAESGAIGEDKLESKDLGNEAGGDKMVETKQVLGSSFVFKDVEESLETFNGESPKSVTTWLKDFNDIATVCQWNDVQKYLYARRLLRGAARLAIESASGIHSWASLQAKLEEEFKDEPSCLSIHRSLESRKKAATESSLEYMYAMKQIASRASIDDESLIAYIIAGISDDVQSKSVLYGAKTLKELKANIKTYETIKASQKLSSPHKRSQNKNNPTAKTSPNPKRCYNCGSRTHLTAGCPDKSKGAKCFNCGGYGHLSANCPKPRASRSSTSRGEGEKGSVSTISCPDLSVSVKFGEGEYKALVDTGSGVTLVRQTIVEESKVLPEMKGPSITLTGFGQNLKRTLGSIQATLSINGDTYSNRVHIVPDNWITSDILIGMDIIKQGSLRVEGGKMSLIKAVTTMQCAEPNFLGEIDVVQLVEESDFDCLSDIDNTEYRQEISRLISEYSPKKPENSCIKMEIHLEDRIKPIYCKPRKLAPKEKEETSKQVDKWLEEGIIRPSHSDFASPVVLAKKKDGSYRLCIDYRKINRYIVKDRYPLPVMEDVLESLHSASVFTTLDLRNGFFHVDVAEGSKKFTAFLTNDGQYEFNKVPFGLCNSPAVFQRFINTVFRPLILNKILLLYMDDIIIPTTDETENIKNLEKTLKVAAKHGLLIKWSKCKFLKRSVEFLGHVVEQGNIRPSDEKTTAIRNFPVPRNVRDVQSFLGLTGFFRKFIPGYSTIAKPLTDLIKKDVKFQFYQKEREAFNTLKESLSAKPVLRLFNAELETELHTDASKVGLGAVLLQKDPNTKKLHPVFYLSFKTTEAEQRYSSYELEALAIVKSLRKLRHYLLGLKFTVYTDCKAFELTMRRKEVNSRVARWALALEEFDCKVLHRSGTSMRHVDALSRHPQTLTIEAEILHRIRQAQKNDDFCRLIKKCLEHGEYEDYSLRNDIIYKFADGNHLLVLPKSLQKAIIRNVHEQGHINARKVELLIRQEYYVPSLPKKVQDVIQNCVACILAARKAGKAEGLLHPIEKIDQPLHTYHIDHLGPLASTAKNYKHLFVIIDAFTKFAWLYPVKSTTSDEAIRKLELQSEVFGNPHRIIADRGTAFTSTSFKTYCEERRINLIFITTGVPRGNGQVERLNQIIINTLSKMSVKDPSKWYQHVPQLQRIINSTLSRSTGKTPFKLMFGVEMSHSEKFELAKLIEEEIIADFENTRSAARYDAKQQIQKVQDENRRYSKKRRKPARKYTPGDMVAIRRVQFTPGGKLFPKFLGPYEVIAAKGHDRYQVRKVGNHEGPNISGSAADLMKPWSNPEEDCSSGTDDGQDGRMWELESSE